MRLTRRGMLFGGAALAALPAISASAAVPALLTARVARMQLLPEGYGETEIWGYEGTMPGPEIRVAQGARVRRRLENALPRPTSIHWHGVRIDNAMDGVAGLTQDAVAPGAGFDYDFVAPDAGTYWYHAHNRSVEEVARGLYGALIVEEPDRPDVDREEVLILDDWRIDPETAQLDADFDAPHDRSHAGRTGNFIATNATYGLTGQARRNERLRLRLINAANARLFDLRLAGLDGWVVALDGMPLSAPARLEERLVLGPAQRADLVVDVTAAVGERAAVDAVVDRQRLPQVVFDIGGEASASRRPPPAPLPPNGHAMVDLTRARPLSLVMEGGAMGGLRAATLGGRQMGFRELAGAGHFWAFNGAVGRAEDPPLAELARGEHVRLTIVNDTAFPHAMHLHGMHFHEIGEDGRPGPLRDTTLLFGNQSRDIAFVADNPGNWLLHCHMLSHAASGMATRIVVS